MKRMKRICTIIMVFLVTLNSFTVMASESEKEKKETTILEDVNTTLYKLDVATDAKKLQDSAEIKREIIVDLRNDKDTLKKSMLEPQLIYEEVVTYSNIVLNEYNELVPATATKNNWTGTGVIYTDSRSSRKSYTYSGTVVTVETILSAKCEDMTNGGGAVAVKPINAHYHWETTNNLDDGDPLFWVNDYDGGYVSSYKYIWAQEGWKYNGENGSFRFEGHKTFNFYDSSGGYYHTVNPEKWCVTTDIHGFYQTSVDYNITFYANGDRSTRKTMTASHHNLGWGDLFMMYP